MSGVNDNINNKNDKPKGTAYFIALVKRAFTVQEWKKAAAHAMANKQFVIREFLDRLHQIEKENPAPAREMQRGPMPQMRPQTPYAPQAPRKPSSAGGPSLAELMAQIREQQNQQ